MVGELARDPQAVTITGCDWLDQGISGTYQDNNSALLAARINGNMEIACLDVCWAKMDNQEENIGLIFYHRRQNCPTLLVRQSEIKDSFKN